MSPIDPDRASGALIGLAVGDALGTTLEFTAPAAAPFSPLLGGPHTEVTGGGPFGVAPGQVTDDTQMAVALHDSLRARGRLEVDDVAARYVAWMPAAFDIGGLTGGALGLVAGGTAAADAGLEAWLARGRNAAGNGSLMRTAPIGVRCAERDRERRAWSMAESAITHFDPRCQLACAGFNGAIACAVRGEAAEVAYLFAVARAELAAATEELAGAWPAYADAIVDAGAALADDLAWAERDDPGLYGDAVHIHRHQGFVRVAFRLAFWELAHAPSYRAGLIDAVNRGGDADTNGAIAGALLGAWHGAARIPARWREVVMSALDGDDGPLATVYHPRVFGTR